MAPVRENGQAKDFIFFDLETTGLDSRRHEILEIGAVRVSADLTTVRGTFEEKIRPKHPETALPEALVVNGYTPEAWYEARELREVLDAFCVFGSGGVLAAYNVTFDWDFLHSALRDFAIPDPFDYHRFDVFSVAYDYAMTHGGVAALDLETVSRFFHLPDPPRPHQALADAQAAFAVLRAIHANIA